MKTARNKLSFTLGLAVGLAASMLLAAPAFAEPPMKQQHPAQDRPPKARSAAPEFEEMPGPDDRPPGPPPRMGDMDGQPRMGPGRRGPMPPEGPPPPMDEEPFDDPALEPGELDSVVKWLADIRRLHIELSEGREELRRNAKKIDEKRASGDQATWPYRGGGGRFEEEQQQLHQRGIMLRELEREMRRKALLTYRMREEIRRTLRRASQSSAADPKQTERIDQAIGTLQRLEGMVGNLRRDGLLPPPRDGEPGGRPPRQADGQGVVRRWGNNPQGAPGKRGEGARDGRGPGAAPDNDQERFGPNDGPPPHPPEELMEEIDALRQKTQSQQKRIDELEARLRALEGKKAQ